MKLGRRLSVLVAAIFTFLTVFSYTAVQAAKIPGKPILRVVTQPAEQYSYGETISFVVTSPNYAGQVEYRVILYNGNTGKTTDLWKIPGTGNYYTSWRPGGNYMFEIHWPVAQMEPGPYSMTVLVRRAGTRVNYDSFVDTRSFWVNMTGNGVRTIYYPNGSKYVGEQINGTPEGNGTMIWANGDTYIGQFRNGLVNGQGTYIWATGDRYKGEYKNDMRDGQGVMTWVNGDKYTGEFRNDEMNGKGTMEWINGNKYTGEYANGTITGYGVMTYADGRRAEGVWANGVLVKPNLEPPKGVRAQAVSNSQIQVGWDAAVNADYYYVYYSYNYNGPFYALTNSDGTKGAYGWSASYSALIPNISPNTTVYIAVTSVKNGVESAYSNIVSAATPANYYYPYQYPYYYDYYYGYPYYYPYDYYYYHDGYYHDYYPYDIVVDSQIVGYFTGWNGNTVFTLTNGQVWQQISSSNVNYNIYMPRVLIFYSDGHYIMRVEGVNESIYVVPIR